MEMNDKDYHPNKSRRSVEKYERRLTIKFMDAVK
jgi:hypothetical protein